MPPGLSDLHLILPRQFQRGLNRFRPAAGEVHTAAGKTLPSEIQQLVRLLFSNRRRELAAVNKLQLVCLIRYRRSNFPNSMPNEVHRRRA
jgi:hypothetical protein